MYGLYLKAQGYEIGKSIREDKGFGKELIEKAKEKI